MDPKPAFKPDTLNWALTLNRKAAPHVKALGRLHPHHPQKRPAAAPSAWAQGFSTVDHVGTSLDCVQFAIVLARGSVIQKGTLHYFRKLSNYCLQRSIPLRVFALCRWLHHGHLQLLAAITNPSFQTFPNGLAWFLPWHPLPRPCMLLSTEKYPLCFLMDSSKDVVLKAMWVVVKNIAPFWAP